MSDTPEHLCEGRFLRLIKRAAWEYVERVGVTSVAVLVPVTSRGEIVLVEQFRIPVQASMVELPAGLVGDRDDLRDEGILQAANRELEEETGFRAQHLEALTTVPSSGGMTSEVATFVLATDLRKVGPGGGVDGEEIVVHVIARCGLRDWLRDKEAQGCLIDPKIYAALYLLGDPALVAGEAGAA